jgi:hypothetical protein
MAVMTIAIPLGKTAASAGAKHSNFHCIYKVLINKRRMIRDSNRAGKA